MASVSYSYAQQLASDDLGGVDRESARGGGGGVWAGCVVIGRMVCFKQNLWCSIGLVQQGGG